ncbi:MAG: NADH-quinone oxidoreductase subunit J [Actinomycetota bacterium]|nr:NADH-quinone oxidoreductase subunit J [Actinomycetota bacterium]
MSETIVFLIAGPIALGSALFIIMSKNAVHSALWLILNLMALAVLFVDLDAQFLGVVQFIIYAGAIMVLFLFVIMLLGVTREELLGEAIPIQRVVSGILGVALAGTLVWILLNAYDESAFGSLAGANSAGNVQGLGRLLFSKYIFPFEVTSILLIVAAIGAMILARGRTEEESASEVERHSGEDVRL